MEIEKRLRSFRFLRCLKMKGHEQFKFYEKLSSHSEVCTCCNRDWYITLFDDREIDSFVFSDDKRSYDEYNFELIKIKNYVLGNNIRNFFVLNREKNNNKLKK